MRRGGGTRPSPSPSDESGSTLVELVTAAGLLLLTVGLVVPNVVVPLGRLNADLEVDVHRVRLEGAADTFARAVRAARPTVREPAVEVTPTTLDVRLSTADGPATVTFELVDGVLRLLPTGGSERPAALPEGVLVAGLDAAASHFDTVGRTADGHAHGVTLVLEGPAGRVERTVRLRTVHPLRAVPRW